MRIPDAEFEAILTRAAEEGSKCALAVLAIATSLLTGCATVESEPRDASVCPPVVEHTSAERRQVARDVEAVTIGALNVVWLADYAVLREWLRSCRS